MDNDKNVCHFILVWIIRLYRLALPFGSKLLAYSQEHIFWHLYMKIFSYMQLYKILKYNGMIKNLYAIFQCPGLFFHLVGISQLFNYPLISIQIWFTHRQWLPKPQNVFHFWIVKKLQFIHSRFVFDRKEKSNYISSPCSQEIANWICHMKLQFKCEINCFQWIIMRMKCFN